MKTEVDITKYKIAAILQIVVMAVFAAAIFLVFIMEDRKTNILLYLGCVLLLIFLNRYIHEACHYIIGRVQGFRCQLKFGLKMSECRVIGVQNWKQVVALALAPLYAYAPALLLLLLAGIPAKFKLLALGVMSILIGSMLGDFIYVYEAFRNKGGKFTDNGHVLTIEKE